MSNTQIGTAINSFPGCSGSMVDMSNKSYWFHAVEIKTCRQGKEKWDLLDIMFDPNPLFQGFWHVTVYHPTLCSKETYLQPYDPLHHVSKYKFMCIPGISVPLVKSTRNFPCPYSITFLHEHMAFRTDPAHNLGPSFFCDPAIRWIFH